MLSPNVSALVSDPYAALGLRPVINATGHETSLTGSLIALAALVQPAAAQSGAASWYGSGSRTANGERFNPNGMTAAHRSLPFGTRVRVKNVRNGRAIVAS